MRSGCFVVPRTSIIGIQHSVCFPVVLASRGIPYDRRHKRVLALHDSRHDGSNIPSSDSVGSTEDVGSHAGTDALRPRFILGKSCITHHFNEKKWCNTWPQPIHVFVRRVFCSFLHQMIPVMLFGVLFAKKRYSLRDYMCVGLITAGIVTFNLSKASHTSQKVFIYGRNKKKGGLHCRGAAALIPF